MLVPRHEFAPNDVSVYAYYNITHGHDEMFRYRLVVNNLTE